MEYLIVIPALVIGYCFLSRRHYWHELSDREKMEWLDKDAGEL